MAKTIFMIHGMWGTPWYWENYKKYFEGKGYRCITPVLRYHDMNPKDLPDPRLGTTSLLDYVADLEQELRQLDEKPIIMGHSMGGLLAQMLGSRGLGQSLVLLCPASPAGIMALRFSVIKSFLSAFTTWGFWKKAMRPTFDEVAYSTLHLMPPAEQKEIYSQFVYESGLAATEIGLWLFDPKGAARVDEKNVTRPVLVISGTEDRIVPSSVVRKVARKYEMVSTYHEFEHHAHWVVGEPGWQEITEYIYQWLKQISEGNY